MLVERNENKKDATLVVAKAPASPKRPQKLFKENLQQVNTKDLLLKSSKVLEGEPAPASEGLATVETNKIAADYLKRILANELSKSPDNFRDDFLARHRFSWEIRARMVA